jgi:preprotein translocase subunit SecD
MFKQLTSICLLPLLTFVLCGSTFQRKQPLEWQVVAQVDAPATQRDNAVKQTIKIIENRLRAFGLTNWAIKAQDNPDNGRITVSLPAAADHERLKRLLTSPGKLEFAHVISLQSPAPAQTYSTREEAIRSLQHRGRIPANRRVLPYSKSNATTGPGSANSSPPKWVVVESPSIIDGSAVRDARAVNLLGSKFDKYWDIWFYLNKDGADKFAKWTAANLREYMGVVLNDEVKSIAFIKTQISDTGEISGEFTRESAQDLALVLRSGSLPFPVRFISESFIQDRHVYEHAIQFSL